MPSKFSCLDTGNFIRDHVIISTSLKLNYKPIQIKCSYPNLTSARHLETKTREYESYLPEFIKRYLQKF